MKLISLDPADNSMVDKVLAMSDETNVHDRDAFAQCRFQLRRLITSSSDTDERHTIVAVDGDEVLGAALIMLPRHENRQMAQLGIMVGPRHRRRGVGGALLDSAVEVGHRHDRTVAVASTLFPKEGDTRWVDSRGFVTANGFAVALTLNVYRLDLTSSVATEDRLWPEARDRSADYELITFTPPTPDDLAPGVLALAARVSTDVPHGDIEVEKPEIDVRRLRESEAEDEAQGMIKRITIARHRETGEFGGYTVLVLKSGVEDTADVGITLVDPDHRGHRLGLALKIEAQRQLRRDCPQVRFIETGNADVNEAMLAINRDLGFELVGHVATVQKKLD